MKHTLDKTLVNQTDASYKFRYKTPISEGHKRIINDPKEPKFEYLLIDEISGNKVIYNDVDAIKRKRNKMIDDFFNIYDDDKYTLTESSFVDTVELPFNRVMHSIKQKTINTKFEVLGYIWIIDVGDNNKRHFHLVLAYEKIDVKYQTLPKFLKYKFKKTKIYSSFINEPLAFKVYLKQKKVYERGYRKRTYGRSIKHKTVGANKHKTIAKVSHITNHIKVY